MANSKISALTSATTPLAGTETLPVVQSSATTKVTVANLTAGRSVSGSNFVVTSSTIPANGVYLPAANSVGIATNSTLRATIDASGNMGLGVTPVASVYAPSRNLFVGQASTLIGRTTINFTSLNTNVYEAVTTSVARFINASTAAAQYYQYLGAHVWQVSTNTPTADTAITWSTAMTLDASSNLGIGVTPAVKLDVLGTIQAAAAATQDAVRLAGRAGGTGTFAVTISPTTLTASRTLTLPDATTTVVGTDATQTLTNKTLSSGTLTGTLTAGGGVGTSGQFLQSTATGVQWAAATGTLAKQTDVFTSGTAATYTAPANTQWVKVTVVGCGGNGGAALLQRGTGGSAGAVAIKWLAMTAGQTLIYTVSNSVGTASTVSSGTLTITTITANSGLNGSTAAYTAGVTIGNQGGSASGGDINISGGAAGSAYGASTSVTTQISGVGGNCPGFGNGGNAVGGAISSGNNATGYGAGGSGAVGSVTVGNAVGGVIIFEAF